jgi:hypothetical protein
MCVNYSDSTPLSVSSSFSLLVFFLHISSNAFGMMAPQSLAALMHPLSPRGLLQPFSRPMSPSNGTNATCLGSSSVLISANRGQCSSQCSAHCWSVITTLHPGHLSRQLASMRPTIIKSLTLTRVYYVPCGLSDKFQVYFIAAKFCVEGRFRVVNIMYVG